VARGAPCLREVAVVRLYHRPGPCANPQTGTRPLAKPPALCHTINMKNGNEVMVYSVMGSSDWSGFDGDTLQLFDCKSAAYAYSEHLYNNCGFDYVEVKVIEVQQHSALAA
jgi:hypothetical protein